MLYKLSKNIYGTHNYILIILITIRLFGIHDRDGSFNHHMIRASQDLEEALVGPIHSPLIGTEPIRGAVFLSPTQNSDGVEADWISGNMLVDT